MKKVKDPINITVSDEQKIAFRYDYGYHSHAPYRDMVEDYGVSVAGYYRASSANIWDAVNDWHSSQDWN